jgi:ribosome biogenesis protein Nip4
MIERFISQFTEQKLLYVEKIGRQYYQIQPELKELMLQINSRIHRQPVSAGLFLGEEKGKEFKPSIALLDLIGHASQRWVMVDDKAEWLFLCGRDVFGKSVVKANVNSGIALVVNSKKEVLGYGKITGELKNKERVFVKNILDRGDYLRREMGRR